MKFQRYESRYQAGEILAELICDSYKDLKERLYDVPDEFLCFAIPNGGVPVAEGFCSEFGIKYDIMIVRKIKIPYNTEAGFGSITTDESILINKPLLAQIHLSEDQIEKSISLTKKEIKNRLKLYHKSENLQEFYQKTILNKEIFMIDDGLASGFTMLAAIQMIHKYHPKRIYIAVPTAPLHTIQKIEPIGHIDKIFCPNIRDVWQFAVADAYQNWYDVPESEVLEIISQSKYYIQ
ncbi:MAG: phosphoribosyltransferase [Candidatus Lokiarchaeota archaeon]|nr:phosphoribosyltransferase [Candidatus Lokiarchaeota archaeon]